MIINFNINENHKELNILLSKDTLDEEVTTILNKLSNSNPENILCYIEKDIFPVNVKEIYRIYTKNNKVYLKTKDTEYLVKHRLYELESMLDEKIFLRISNCDIVNMKKIKKLDLSITGTIKVYFTNNDFTFVSRRYISKVKDFLNL